MHFVKTKGLLFHLALIHKQVPEITSHFFSSIITGIQDIIENTKYNAIICVTDESYENEVAIVENLLKMGIDGLLVSPSSSTKKRPF